MIKKINLLITEPKKFLFKNKWYGSFWFLFFLFSSLGLYGSLKVDFGLFGIDPDTCHSLLLWHGINDFGISWLNDWMFTQDNWVFSLVPIHFLGFLLFGAKPVIAVLSGWLFFVLSALISGLVAWQLNAKRSAFLIPLALLFLGHYAHQMAAVSYPSHNITNLFGLVSLLLVIKWAKKQQTSILFFILLLLVAGGLSDPWMLPAYNVPFVIVSILLLVSPSIKADRIDSIKLLLVSAGSILVVKTHFFGVLNFLPDMYYQLGGWSTVNSNCVFSIKDLGGLLNIVPFQNSNDFIPAVLSIGIIATLIFKHINIAIRKNLHAQNEVFVFFSFSFFSVGGILLALILSSLEADILSSRFLLNCLYLIAIGLGVLVDLNWQRLPKTQRVFSASVIILFILSGSVSNFQLWKNPVLALNDGGANSLIDFLRKNNLSYGYGPYWGSNANAVTTISKSEIRIRPVQFNKANGMMITGNRPQSSKRWYTIEDLPADQKNYFVFVISDGEECADVDLCIKGLSKQFGDPSRVLKYGDAFVLVWNHPLIPFGIALKKPLDGFTLTPAPGADTLDSKKSAWPGVISSARGLSSAEPWGTWSSSDVVTLEFSKPLPEKFAVHLVAHAFGPNVGKEFVAHVGDSAVRFTLAGSPEERVLEFTNPKRSRIITIDVPSPCSPKELGLSDDDRSLGIGLTELGVEPLAGAGLPVPADMACAALPYCPYRPDGKPGREIAVSLRGTKLYGAVTFDVECAGAKERTTVPANGNGADFFSIFLPAGVNVTNKCEATVELHSGRTALKQMVDVPACKPRVYYVLMHSHCDIGYTDIQPHIADKQAHNVIHALELIEKTKDYPPGAQFKWNTEGFWQVEQFYKIATAEQKAKFEQAVREQRIGVDAMYANLLTGLERGEELLRQTEFATELDRRCGVKCESMMISDVPGLTWGIVPSLAQAGVKYISDGPNPGDRIGYARELWENHPFVWVSPSGKERVIYWGAQGGYAIGHHCGSIRDAIAELTLQLEKWGYPYDIVQLRWTKGDNRGPDESVMPIVRNWNAKYAWPKLVISTTTEMFHEFEKRYGDKLPVYRGDMTPYWEDGAGSSARETGINRLSSDRMTQGEILWTLLKPDALPTAGYAEALKNIAMYNEHTWGAYNSISAPDSDFVKTQWKIKQAFALDGEAETKKLLADALATRGPAPEAGNKIDVFNSTSWPRTDLVTCPKTMKPAGDVVRNDRDEIVPSQRLSTGEVVFMAKDIPPFGGRRFTIEVGSANASGAAKANGATLADSTITLKLDPTSGAIESLRANGVDHEFVNAATNMGLNAYVYLSGGNVSNAQRNGPAKISVKENGPLVASLLVESDAPGCNKLLREIRLVSGLDRVEIIDTVDKKAVRSVEGVHIGFGFNVPDAALRINIPWGVTQPEKDQLAGACKNWFSVERWVDISNGKLGVTWSTVEAPLLEVGGLTANLPRSQPNPRVYMFKIEASPTIYSWVMNNHWHTNYRADQEGETVFHYAIRPHTAYDQTAAAHFGVESTEPLIAAPAAGPAPAGPLVEISSGPIMITSLTPSADGRALLLRLFNTGETVAQASLKWNAAPPKEIFVSDLSGLPGSRASSAVEMVPYEVRTLRVELK